MVAKFIASVRRMPWRVALLLCLVALVPILLLSRGRAEAATFTTPFWANNSPSPECICDCCGCERPSEWYQNVSVRTGELALPIPLFSSPGLQREHSYSLLCRSMNTVVSEFGRGMLASWQWMAQKTILNPGSPSGLERHAMDDLPPDGLTVTYVNNLNGGATYSTSDCGVHDTLTVNGSGNAVLTDKFGGDEGIRRRTGCPTSTPTSTAGRSTSRTTRRFSGHVDRRTIAGASTTFHHNLNGFVDYADQPDGSRVSFASARADNLTGITSPATPDQSLGITSPLSYDGGHRLTAIEDGAGNTPWHYAYVIGTSKVSQITGSTIALSYSTNRTDVTDRNGIVLRFTYSGKNISQTDYYIGEHRRRTRRSTATTGTSSPTSSTRAGTASSSPGTGTGTSRSAGARRPTRRRTARRTT